MRRWAVRLLGGLIVVALAGFGIRSWLLPDRSAFVFLDYADDTSWERAPESPLFQDGDLAFAAREPIQLGGQDQGSWDEVAIVNFDRSADYETFVERLAAEPRLVRYHLMEISPGPPELLFFLNRRLRSYRGDASVDPGEAAPLEDAIGDERYAQQWRDLFDGSYRDAIVMLNLLTDREEPEDGTSNEELHQRYQEKAFRVLGKLGGQVLVLGSVDQVVVGPEVRKYGTYAFAFYPSVDDFRIMFTSRERLDARVHRDEALSAEDSAGYWSRPYPEFVSNTSMSNGVDSPPLMSTPVSTEQAVSTK